MRALLTGPDASVRLVLTPEKVVLAEARRSYTTLSLFGYRVDGVVANRVFPAEGADDWRAGWVLAQDEVLEQVAESFAGLPVWRSVYRPAEPVGVHALTDLGRERVRRGRPAGDSPGDGPVPDHPHDAAPCCASRCRFVSRAEVDLARNGDDWS